MDHHLEIANQREQLRVSTTADEHVLEVEIEGVTRRFAFSSPGPNQILLNIEGRNVECWVARTNGSTWLWTEGRARLVREVSGRRRPTAGGAMGREVTPSMPAVVTAVLVEPGDCVEQGQALVVLSAMKMETTLVAPFAGTVCAVNTQVEANVSPGNILVEIQPEPKERDDDA